MENAWQDISSAPRDDTPVLVYSEYPITGYKAMYIAKYDYSSQVSRIYKEVYGNMYNIQPKYWMPLPKPPVTAIPASTLDT